MEEGELFLSLQSASLLTGVVQLIIMLAVSVYVMHDHGLSLASVHGGIGGAGGGGGEQGGSGGHGEGPQWILKEKNIWVNHDNTASKFFRCV